ncbi:MAG: ATP-binding protein [Acidimicrobiales bacterium]|nr:ATP-binding protein [Acidimicrobiales bacterium]
MIRQHRAFEPHPGSVSAARDFVTAVLSEWAASGPHPLLGAAQLVVSELASNAVLHARTPFAVEVSADGDVLIAVADESGAAPVMRRPSPDALDGRGLYLVDQTSEEWGFDPTDGGKRVWCRLAPSPY